MSRPLTERDLAAYLLDRAEQYGRHVERAWAWMALIDAAEAVLAGDVRARRDHGEFDEELMARVDELARRPP